MAFVLDRNTVIPIAADLVAITVMVFLIYFPRHRRRDLVVAYLTINVGVLAFTTVLATSQVGAGLGLGLFGVLSIIRLRSTELDQEEIAYYFAALSLAMVGGLAVSPIWLGPSLMLAVLIAVYVGDHPNLLARYQSQTVSVGRAYLNRSMLLSYLEESYGVKIDRLQVRRVDLVNDTTLVDIRYRDRKEESTPDDGWSRSSDQSRWGRS